MIDRATFEAAELSIVLSYYDLGVVESITEFPRGSRHSPKVGIVCDRGKFLLKRRSPHRSNLERVQFAHRLVGHLAAQGFPVPRLIPTRDTGRTLVQLQQRVYELFEFVGGQGFQRTERETRFAGSVLSRFHDSTLGFSCPRSIQPPRGDYHDAGDVRSALRAIGSSLSLHDSFTGDESELESLVADLSTTYATAARSANQSGIELQSEQVVHADWHPGNLVFRHDDVVAVVDFDSVRMGRRVIDVANGALQFSMLAAGDPHSWPDELDEPRLSTFLEGYRSTSPLTAIEVGVIPELMVEALIAECVAPIHQTGSMGRWGGFRILKMVHRKTQWILRSADRLRSLMVS